MMVNLVVEKMRNVMIHGDMEGQIGSNNESVSVVVAAENMMAAVVVVNDSDSVLVGTAVVSTAENAKAEVVVVDDSKVVLVGDNRRRVVVMVRRWTENLVVVADVDGMTVVVVIDG